MLSVQTSDSPEVAELALKAAGYEVEKSTEESTTALPAETEKPKEPAGTPAGETKEKTVEAAAETPVKEAEKPAETLVVDAASGTEAKKETGSAREKRIRKELQAQVKTLAAEVETLKSKPQGGETARPEPKPRPKREDFLSADDPDAAFDQAATDWTLEEAERRVEVKQTKKAAETREQEQRAATEKTQKTALETFEAKADELRDEFEDFDEVTKETPVTTAMAHVIMGVEDSARLFYELGKNHPELALDLVVATDLPATATDAQYAAAAKLAKLRIQKVMPDFFKNGNGTTPVKETTQPLAVTPANGNGAAPKKTAPKLPAPPPPKLGGTSAGEKVGIDYEAMAKGQSPIADFEKATRGAGR